MIHGGRKAGISGEVVLKPSFGRDEKKDIDDLDTVSG